MGVSLLRVSLNIPLLLPPTTLSSTFRSYKKPPKERKESPPLKPHRSHELILDGDYPRFVALKPDGTFVLTDLSTGPFAADLDGDNLAVTTSAFTVNCDGFVQVFTQAPLVDRDDETFPWQVTTDPNVGGTTINQPLSPDDFIKVLPVAGVAPVSAAKAETVEDSEDEADAAADADAAAASAGVLTPKKKNKGKRGSRRNLWEQRLRRSRWERRADGADDVGGGDDAGASGPAYPRCPAAPAGLLSTVKPGARQPMANGTCAQMGGAKVPVFDFTGCCNSHDLCFGELVDCYVSLPGLCLHISSRFHYYPFTYVYTAPHERPC